MHRTRACLARTVRASARALLCPCATARTEKRFELKFHVRRLRSLPTVEGMVPESPFWARSSIEMLTSSSKKELGIVPCSEFCRSATCVTRPKTQLSPSVGA
jgi:hypothetical protein